MHSCSLFILGGVGEIEPWHHTVIWHTWFDPLFQKLNLSYPCLIVCRCTVLSFRCVGEIEPGHHSSSWYTRLDPPFQKLNPFHHFLVLSGHFLSKYYNNYASERCWSDEFFFVFMWYRNVYVFWTYECYLCWYIYCVYWHNDSDVWCTITKKNKV